MNHWIFWRIFVWLHNERHAYQEMLDRGQNEPIAIACACGEYKPLVRITKEAETVVE